MTDNQAPSANTKRKNDSQSLSKRAKRRKYKNMSNKEPSGQINYGMSGIFISGIKRKERQAAAEIFDLAHEYIEKFYPELMTTESISDNEDLSIEDQMAKEVETLQSENNKSNSNDKLLQVRDTGIDCLVFLKIDKRVNPADLVEKMMDDLMENKKHRTRHVQRVVPFQTICKADTDKIVESAKPIVESVFHTPEGKTLSFAVQCRIRNNDRVHQQKTIVKVAELLEGYKVDLNNPDYTILIEVFKTYAGISLVKSYKKFRKFNLMELYEKGVLAVPRPSKSSESTTVSGSSSTENTETTEVEAEGVEKSKSTSEGEDEGEDGGKKEEETEETEETRGQ
ncbi:hypothetical protein BKA69DRAFT_526610 [Paraphysoderma sedebokerense]|nr:hypothetical protein BKA69DRAFT_526610 [Paraphysoderma sedebokerense]